MAKMLTTLFKFLLMFLFERLKNPNNKTPNIKKKKQKSYRWEMVWICHSTAAPVRTQAAGRDVAETNMVLGDRMRYKKQQIQESEGHKTPTVPHLSLTSNEKHRQNECFRLVLHCRWKPYLSW